MVTEILVAVITAVIIGIGAVLLIKSRSKFSESQLRDLALNLGNDEGFVALLLSKFSSDGRFKGSDGKDGLPAFREVVENGDNFAALFGKDLQICWGHAELKTDFSHTRIFKFEFAVPFSEVPTVTNGVNADASGWAFSVYNYDLSATSYEGHIVEQENRKNTAPVKMNYIAIGKR